MAIHLPRLFYFNFAPTTFRSWVDCRNRNVVSAGGMPGIGKKLEDLKSGDELLVFVRGRGYLAHAVVTGSSRKQNGSDPTENEFEVPVRWKMIREKAVGLRDSRIMKSRIVLIRLGHHCIEKRLAQRA